MEIALNYESVEVIRELADALTVVMGNITDSTIRLVEIYQSVYETVGPHREEFQEMLRLLKMTVEDMSDSVMEMPPKMRRTADEMEAFIAKKLGHGVKTKHL